MFASNCRYIASLVFLLGLLLISAGQTGQAASLPVVRVAPATGSYGIGDVIHVDVWIDNVNGLFGADVQLKVDPLTFEVLDEDLDIDGIQVIDAGFLPSGFTVKNQADNAAGTIWFAKSLLNPEPAVSGSGILFSFNLKVRPGWNGGVLVASQQLSNINGDEIIANHENAAYVIEGMLANFVPLVWCANCSPAD